MLQVAHVFYFIFRHALEMSEGHLAATRGELIYFINRFSLHYFSLSSRFEWSCAGDGLMTDTLHLVEM